MTEELPEVIVTEHLTLVRRPDDASPSVHFDLRTTKGDRHVGTGRLEPLEDGDWQVELLLDEPERGRGFGGEAGRALLAFGFSELRAARVVVEVPVEDERALRLAEHLGLNGQGVQGGLRRYLAWRAPGATPPRRRR